VEISVVIPTHNPRDDYLNRVIAALREQTLPRDKWELLLVDNASEQPLANRYDLSWQPSSHHIREEKVGLTRARLAGFQQARASLVVLVDDDNVLASNYLIEAAKIARDFSFLGSWSGNVMLEFEEAAHLPPPELRYLLCERLVEKPLWSNDPGHIAATPWGAGMCIRRQVFEAYAKATHDDPRRFQLDLQGKDLAYGGDTDIAYTGCSIGFGMGVFPQLKVNHLIPESRCKIDYLLKNLEAHAYSEILHHWIANGNLHERHPDLTAKLRQGTRWLLSDSLGRKIIEARRRGATKARRQLAK
jgi:glycosyltransferase involved in cell wall biosynthesis